MNRTSATIVALASLAWLPFTATPAGAEEACTTVVLCEQASDPAPAQPEPAQPQPQPQPQPTTTTTTAPAPRPMSQAEAADHILRRMNEERAAHRLPALHRRGDVDAVAQSWSQHLADERRLSHNDAFFTPESSPPSPGSATTPGRWARTSL
jgi:uncharacterized protein YkwD